ncbi:MAG: NADH dehydrogenase [ubiquinone] 1 alpha subcomplex assembly factor 1 [Pseudohongiellaceae bacterium]|jgi:NADH dehydrogenase [ubiquinone] 1 alpha subcomplex assembly factor 1
MKNNRKYLSHSTALSYSIIMLALLFTPLSASESNELDTLTLTSFNADSPDFGWYVQNDNVMGGRSEGGFDISSGELIFSGNTNTNGGGFSSIRTQPLTLDLSAYTGIRVKVKADGRRYTWGIKTDARWRGRRINYWADFDTLADEPIIIDIPFTNFLPQFRGFKLDGPELDTSQIAEFALYQYDKTDGPFELRLITVEAYKESQK